MFDVSILIKSNESRNGVPIGSWRNPETIELTSEEIFTIPQSGQRIVYGGKNYIVDSSIIDYDQRRVLLYVERSYF